MSRPASRSREVAYARAESPLGPLLVAATSEGLVAIGLPAEDDDDLLGRLERLSGVAPVESRRRLAPALRELEEYFGRRRTRFDLPLDWSLAAPDAESFHRRALEALLRIPYGATATYSELAAEAGNPRAPRAAGHACATNPIPIVVPCHRAVRRDGGLGGYPGGVGLKRLLLDLEGGDESSQRSPPESRNVRAR